MDKEESQKSAEAMKTACEKGDFEKVFELIEAGQDPRHTLPWDQKRKPLHYAAFHGNFKVVRRLIEEHGCIPHSVDVNNYTPLHYACCGGHNDIVKYLVNEQNCNPSAKGHERNRPLHFTCMHEILNTYSINVHVMGFGYHSIKDQEPMSGPGHYEVAKFLLTEGRCNVTGSKKHARPLVVHLACRYGTAEFVQFLIKQKTCCPNSQNKDKEVPVHVASKHGNVKILRYLVEMKHCSLVQKNKDGNTPLHLACMFQCIEVVQYLVRKQQDLTMVANHNGALPTHIACCEHSLEIVKLVTSPSNVTAKDNNGATPLHIASACGSLEVVKWLIEELHCDPNIKDDNLSTPLHYACGNAYVKYNYNRENGRNMQIAEYLVVSCGCDPMKSRLMQIACREDLELVKLLTSSNVNCVDEYGNTPLHLACKENKIKVVQYLVLERNCRQDIQNDRGELPLYIACSQPSTKRDRWLQPLTEPLELVSLVSDCDINIQTKSGDTPVHVACRHSQIDIVTYLTQERHCDLNISNNEGKLPLHIACQQNSLEMVKLVSSCDLHAQTKRGVTAMHMACKNTAIKIVEYLVQEKCWKCNGQLKLYDDLLIHCACAKGSGELVRKLANPTNVNLKFPNNDSTSQNESDIMSLHFDDNVSENEFYDASGNMPLHEACKCTNVEVVTILVEEFQCDKAVQNSDGELPLHLACRVQSLEIVEIVTSVYDATVQNNAGETPLHVACKYGQMDIVNYLTEKCVCDHTIQDSSSKLAVHYACAYSLEMVEQVSDCDLECGTSHGVTPLHVASLYRKLDIVRYLIEKKCSPDIETSDGLTLLDYACGNISCYYDEFSACGSDPELKDKTMHAQAAVVEYLMNKCDYDPANVLSLFVKGCKENNLKIAKLLCTNTDIVNSSDTEGNTPLHIACMCKCLELVKFLTKERKCNQQVKNRAGKLPLHVACECCCQLEIVELVSNCDINAQTTLGDTSLNIACKCGETMFKVIEFLIQQPECDQTIPNNDRELPLHIACGKNCLDVVKLLDKCDFNAQTAVGNTPLHIACRNNRIEAVKFLTEQCGCDQTIQNNNGELPLHIACNQSSLSVVELLNKCDFNAQTAVGNTPLHIACRNNNVELVQFLTEQCGCDQTIQNKDGELPLHIACSQSSLPVVELINKCDFNAQTAFGNTPLHIACRNNNVELVQFLTEQCGCDQTIQNKDGELPLHIACKRRSFEVVKLVSNCEVNVQKVNKQTPLHIVCRHPQQIDIAHFLVHSKGADPSILDGSGRNLLHEACMSGNLPLVKILAASTTVNYKDKCGNTPLHVACNKKHLNIAKFLVEDAPTKTNPNIQNHCGDLALHIACENHSLALTKLLSSCTSNPNVKNCAGNTPLHVACKERDERCVKHLVERNCDVSVPNDNGEIPLHIAANIWSIKAVKLVRHCEVNSRTLSGDTPLHIACRKGNPKVVKYLTKTLKCDPNIQNKMGELPLHVACSQASLEIVQFVSNCEPNIETSSGSTPLHVVCKWSFSVDILRYLVTKKNCNQMIANNKGELPLHLACKWSVEAVQLVSNCNINSQTTDGNTPLHIACKENKLEIVKYLTITEAKKCDTNIQNHKGELPLHIACAKGNLEMAMLVCNCNVNALTTAGDTPLHLALYGLNGDDLVKFIITNGPCDFTIRNHEGKLPLHIACETYTHSMKIIRLVSSGVCNTNAKMKSGDTPLHIVCRKYNCSTLEVVKYLVKERHCDLRIQNNEGELPLHIACQNCSLDVVKLVSECDVELQTVSGDTPLLIACQRGIPDIVEYLIKVRQCNPRAQNSDSESPLHIACKMYTKLEIVKLLCDCDVNTQTLKSGDTPLHYACKYNSYYHEAVKYLVEEKLANPTIQNSNGQLPLHIACSNISFKLVELLSKYNADFNCRTLTGDTPLHEVCKVDSYRFDENKQVVQFLVAEMNCDPNCQNNAGMTPLHYACKLNARDIVLYLVSTGKVGPSVTTKNSEGQTPIMCTNDIEIIRELLKHGADPHPLYQRYEQFFKECSSEAPPPTPFSVLVLGNASTGKTTLIESLKAEGKLVVQDTSPDAHTAGIIPNDFESKEYGLVTFYDFAGQYEYYAGHEAVIRTIVRSTPPAILLLINISESEETIQQKILYWLSFIGNQFSTVMGKPYLITAGSHADLVADNAHTKMKSIIDSIKSQLEKSTAKFIAFVTMDCRVSESPGISNLRKQLQKSSKELKDYGVMNFMSHCFHVYLLEYFQHLPAVSLSQITSCLLQKQKSEYHTYPSYYPHRYYHYQSEDKKPERLLPTKPSEIDSILEELSEKGHVVFLKSFCRRSSWVILNKVALLGEINGPIFAPKGFKQYRSLASSTGVVPFSTIANHFSKFDPNMIVSFLSHLEFCHVIADEEALNLIEGNQTNSTTSGASSESYFFFPHLVSIECPQYIWRADENFEYQCGWLLWCSEDDHFFTPRFLQVILLRLAFSFALNIPIRKHRDHPAIQRKCSIWKNGISWLNEDGIEVLVEVREQNQVVTVMMRCDEVSETKIECIHLRSSLVQKILRTREEFCSKVSTTEAFIKPDELQYPLRPPQDLTLFSLNDVARSVINKKRNVTCSDGINLIKLEKLLLFEPYSDFGREVFKELLDKEKKDTEVTDELLNRIANEIVRKKDSKYIDYKKECFLQLFDPHPASLQEGGTKGPVQEMVKIFQLWRARSKDRSYEGLRRKLDEYSVFCGRNPLVRFHHAVLS